MKLLSDILQSYAVLLSRLDLVVSAGDAKLAKKGETPCSSVFFRLQRVLLLLVGVGRKSYWKDEDASVAQLWEVL